jgi:hypothetical protein
MKEADFVGRHKWMFLQCRMLMVNSEELIDATEYLTL